MPSALTDLPDLVPASMLGAYAYCPRLFFLEWVDALWATNADLAEGRRLHTHVDAGGGAAPLPAEGTIRAARSVAMATTSGMAKPRACGQAMTRTVMVRTTASSG